MPDISPAVNPDSRADSRFVRNHCVALMPASKQATSNPFRMRVSNAPKSEKRKADGESYAND